MVLYPLVPIKSLGQLLDISPRNFIFFKNFEILKNQNSKPLEIEDEINIALVIS